MIKKLDIYLLKNFLGLFVATLFICIFILLMQFMWLHIQDLVGKGIELAVLAEFFVYAVCTVVPLALPLAILLASLISFGNLGEDVELTAMKAAGISLFRIMRPLALAVALISVGAFFFSNNILPKSQTKLWALIFSLRQKSPELEIPEGEFYSGIPGNNLYVKHKDRKSKMLREVMIYDMSKGFQNATVTVADSAQMYFTADKKYLLLRLWSGESFENLKEQSNRRYDRNVPYRREHFEQKEVLIDFSTELNRLDDDILQDQHVSKDVGQLIASIDSVNVLAHQQSRTQAQQIVNSRYFNRERRTNTQVMAPPPGDEKLYQVDDLYGRMDPAQRMQVWRQARDKAASMKDLVDYNAMMLDEHQRYVRRHEIELHRKFTLAFACLIFFFIGAPLGAIIRKGGLGAPVVISVVLFVIYYIIDNTGYKMAREALWPCWQGMWLSSGVLLPVGIFLTWKAATDSALFRTEVWWMMWERVRLRMKS